MHSATPSIANTESEAINLGACVYNQTLALTCHA